MVKLTNAPMGRTYIISRSVESFFDHDQDKWSSRTVEQTSDVPNGKWVMKQPSGWAWLVGVDNDELDDLRYIDKYDTNRVLYISDKPFGFIVADEEDVDQSVYPPVPNGRRRLAYARQIQKGELGQAVPVKRIPCVKQAHDPNQHTHQRQRRYGWVRLNDLADATSLSNRDVVLGYWNYSGHRNYRYYDTLQDGGVLLDIVRGTSGEIQGNTPRVFSLTHAQAYDMLGGWNGHRFYTGDVWVRRGFAYTVLRLVALGVQPSVPQQV